MICAGVSVGWLLWEEVRCIETAESREMQCVDCQRADMQKTSVGYGLVSLGWMLCEEKDALK